MVKFNTTTAAIWTVKALILATVYCWFTFSAKTPNMMMWPAYLRLLLIPAVVVIIAANTKK